MTSGLNKIEKAIIILHFKKEILNEVLSNEEVVVLVYRCSPSKQTSLRRNSPCYHSAGLWTALSIGWKSYEDLLWIMSSFPIWVS